MNATDLSPVVVILAVQGDRQKIRSCVDQAARDGLGAVVFTTADAGRSVVNGSTKSPRLIAVSGYQLREARGSARRLLARVASMSASLIFRSTRAARYRLSLPEPANDFLEKMGSVSQSRLPALATKVADRLVEPLLRTVAFMATKVQYGRVIGKEMKSIVAGRGVVGVACLDDASLFPGWLIARRYPTLSVIAGYPGRWEVEAERSRDLFERGDTW